MMIFSLTLHNWRLLVKNDFEIWCHLSMGLRSLVLSSLVVFAGSSVGSQFLHKILLRFRNNRLPSSPKYNCFSWLRTILFESWDLRRFNLTILERVFKLLLIIWFSSYITRSLIVLTFDLIAISGRRLYISNATWFCVSVFRIHFVNALIALRAAAWYSRLSLYARWFRCFTQWNDKLFLRNSLLLFKAKILALYLDLTVSFLIWLHFLLDFVIH